MTCLVFFLIQPATLAVYPAPNGAVVRCLLALLAQTLLGRLPALSVGGPRGAREAIASKLERCAVIPPHLLAGRSNILEKVAHHVKGEQISGKLRHRPVEVVETQVENMHLTSAIVIIGGLERGPHRAFRDFARESVAGDVEMDQVGVLREGVSGQLSREPVRAQIEVSQEMRVVERPRRQRSRESIDADVEVREAEGGIIIGEVPGQRVAPQPHCFKAFHPRNVMLDRAMQRVVVAQIQVPEAVVAGIHDSIREEVFL